MATTHPGDTIPGAWHSNIINTVKRPTVANPGEGRVTKRPKCGRDAPTELHQGLVEDCTAKVLPLAQACTANSGRHSRAQTSIGINKEHYLRPAGQQACATDPPTMSYGRQHLRPNVARERQQQCTAST